MLGQPGGAYAYYLNPDGSLNGKRVAMDLMKCVANHRGGFTTEAFIHTVQQHPDAEHPLKTPLRFLKHGRHGATDFKNFPGEARKIIQSGRLAIIQGVEMDQMGQMFPNCDAKCEVDQLWNMGAERERGAL